MIEVKFADQIAVINDGQWSCKTDKDLERLCQSFGDDIHDSPSIPDLDRERALDVAKRLGGEILTPLEKKEWVKDRIY